MTLLPVQVCKSVVLSLCMHLNTRTKRTFLKDFFPAVHMYVFKFCLKSFPFCFQEPVVCMQIRTSNVYELMYIHREIFFQKDSMNIYLPYYPLLCIIHFKNFLPVQFYIFRCMNICIAYGK